MRINSIDITKFLLSFVVIALHTLYLTENPISDIRLIYIFFKLAVPFFFITSGYFLFRKVTLTLDNLGKKHIFMYLKYIFKLYLLWTIIYLPISIYGAYISKASIGSFCLYSIRKFLFVGEGYYSWNLWYLHGLIIAVFLIFWCLVFKLKPKYILFLGLVVFISGLGLEYLLENELSFLPSFLTKLLNLYLFIFERVRNGFFDSFVYVAIGFYLSKQTKLDLSLGWGLFIIGLISYYFKITIGLLPFATGFFILICHIKLKSNRFLSYFKVTSTLIYLTHMIFIFSYLVLLKWPYHPLSLFIFTASCSYISATIIYWLSKKHPKLGCLYGK